MFRLRKWVSMGTGRTCYRVDCERGSVKASEGFSFHPEDPRGVMALRLLDARDTLRRCMDAAAGRRRVGVR